MEYPCTMDMVQMITQSILGTEQQIEQLDNDNEEVKVNE